MDEPVDDAGPPDLIDVTDQATDDTEAKNLSRKVPISIVTEFGNTTDIEKALTVSQNGTEAQEWIPLANGCICCSIKDSGVAALESLVERQKNFDYILLETTGVADPGNIAPMFWMDEGLGSSIYLDGIVTVVDAKNILHSLDEPSEEELPPNDESLVTTQEHNDHSHRGPLLTIAHLQISHADVILLNKTDLVSASDLESVQARIKSINGLAKVIPTNHSKVDDLSGTVLDLYAYSSFPTHSLSVPPSTTTNSKPNMPDFTSKGHSHLDPTISTLTIPLPEFEVQKLPLLEAWLQNVLWNDIVDDGTYTKPEYEVHRTKGYVVCTDGPDRVVQGVREVFEMIEVVESAHGEEMKEQGPPQGRIVFIGRRLDRISVDW